MEQTPHAVAPDLGGTDDLVQGESGVVKTTALPRPFAPQLRAVITNASSSTAASTTAVTVSTWSIGSPPWQAHSSRALPPEPGRRGWEQGGLNPHNVAVCGF